MSSRLAGVIPDNEVNEEGDFVHYFTLLADSEPINYEVEMLEKVWKDAQLDARVHKVTNK